MGLLKPLLILFVCAAGPAVAGPFEDATEAYNKGDYATALRLFRPLADEGDADAQFHLGSMYDLGRGVPIDDTAAVSWWRRAADQGNALAQLNLAYMYYLGQGVPRDAVQAYMWFSLATSQRGRIAAEDRKRKIDKLDVIELQLTDDQLAKARKLAREWKPKPER